MNKNFRAFMYQILYPATGMAPSGGPSLWKISNGSCKHNSEALKISILEEVVKIT